MQKKYVTSPSSKRAHTTSTQGEKQRQNTNTETSGEMIVLTLADNLIFMFDFHSVALSKKTD